MPSDTPAARDTTYAAALLIGGAFAVYLVFQVHALLYHGYWGQDWIAHKAWIREAAIQPWTFAKQYTRYRTNPPAYDLIAGAIRRSVGLRHYLTAVGLLDVLLGLAGMGFVLAIVRRLIASPLLRAACIIFILFLPFAMIHAEVIANDALATPVFWGLLWLIGRFDPRARTGVFVRSILALAVALIAAVEVKFTFGSVIIATTVMMLLQWWTERLSASRLGWVLIATALVPGIFTYAESVRFRHQAGHSFDLEAPQHIMGAPMNPQSILWLRGADVDVLDAPPYNMTIAGLYDLMAANKHSLPAILHLAIFTDVLNIYQYDPYDTYFGRRTIVNQDRMRAAVRAAVPSSLLAVVSLFAVGTAAGWGAVVERRRDDLLLLTLLVASVGWFSSLVVLYPFIPGVYYSGWWLPRLHAPALMGFFVLAFVWIDRLTRRAPRLHAAVLVWVVLQSILQLSFLWPSASDAGKPIVEPNRDMQAAAAKKPVVQVWTWQDGWNPNTGTEAWLTDAIGITINRAPGPAIEPARLHFRVQKGPSLPGSVGAIRVSAPRFSPRTVTFDVVRDVDLDLELAEGRNEIRLDLVAPPTVECRDDPLRRNVRISGVVLR